VIALKSYSQTDTLCINTNTAKRLLFYKIEYYRLDTLVTNQSIYINVLDSANQRKKRLINLCQEKSEKQKQEIELIKKQHAIEIKKIQATNIKPPTFWSNVRKYGIGALFGALLYHITTQ
jgi:peptide subunit release factor RF-3